MIEANYVNKITKTVFIPPRKRQSVKKLNGLLAQNYVDHVSCLPASVLGPSHGSTINSTTSLQSCEEYNNYDNEETNELQVFGGQTSSAHRTNSTVTPSSQSECSLDRQSNRSTEFYTNQTVAVGASSGGGGCGSVSKKRVNIKKPTTPNYEGLESGETSIFNPDLDEENDENRMRYLTMTGTIKRGKKKGQAIDVQLNLSREELEKINMQTLVREEKLSTKSICCTCSPSAGLHVFIFTLICFPIVMLYTGIYSFYIGTLTWYNMFTYFNEEKSCIYKVFMSPILILSYPIAIIFCTVGLGVYAGAVQVGCRFSKWLNEIHDIEKGFYGWLCGILRLSDCSPYEVVVLMDFHPPQSQDANGAHPHSSTEELSL